MGYLITYEDALRICEAYKNFNFYKTEHVIDGYKVVTFNYFLCDFDMFMNPLKDDPNIHALDMRGVTFTFDKNGDLVDRFLMLPKFFNVNQVENTQIDLLKNKRISYVTYKEDGSLIAFMKLPNGKIFAKTQAGFTNEQSKAAMEIYESDNNLQIFVEDSLCAGLTPLFEYVAFDNRIVLKYSGRELCLIGVRNNMTGRYVSTAKMNISSMYGIKTVKSLDIKTIEELEHIVETVEDMEGVVVEFEDEQLVKWKTKWYFNLHGIRTMHVFREDYIIANYLNETLDDVTQELNYVDDKDAFNFIDVVKNAVNNWSLHIEDNVNELVEKYNSPLYAGQWSKFAAENNKSKFFMLVKIKIDRPEKYREAKRDYMLKMTYKLMNAKNIVETFKN